MQTKIPKESRRVDMCIIIPVVLARVEVVKVNLAEEVRGGGDVDDPRRRALSDAGEQLQGQGVVAQVVHALCVRWRCGEMDISHRRHTQIVQQTNDRFKRIRSV
jgi:hypothetical protein